jgi:hypothetical protein
MFKTSESITAGIEDAHGGFLRCETCRHCQPIKPATGGSYFQQGWPTCCGYTMRWWTQRQVDAGEVPA